MHCSCLSKEECEIFKLVVILALSKKHLSFTVHWSTKAAEGAAHAASCQASQTRRNIIVGSMQAPMQAGTCFAITYLILPRGPEGVLLDLEGFPRISTLWQPRKACGYCLIGTGEGRAQQAAPPGSICKWDKAWNSSLSIVERNLGSQLFGRPSDSRHISVQ